MKTDFKRKISLFMAIVMMICTMSNISIMAEPSDGELSTEIISEEIDDSVQSEDMDVINDEETSQEEISEEESSAVDKTAEEVSEENSSVANETAEEVSEESSLVEVNEEDIVLFAEEDAVATAAGVYEVKTAINYTLNFPRTPEEIKKITDYGIDLTDLEWKLFSVSSTKGDWKESATPPNTAKFVEGAQTSGIGSVTVNTTDKKGYFVLRANSKSNSNNTVLRYKVTVEGKKTKSLALTPGKTTKTNGLVIKDKDAAIKEYDLSMTVAKDQVLTNTSVITILSTVSLADKTGDKLSEIETTLTGGSVKVLDIEKLAEKKGYSQFKITALNSGSGTINVYSKQKDLYGRREQQAIIHVTVSDYPNTVEVDEDTPLHIRAGENITFSYSSAAGVYYQVEGDEKVILQAGSAVDQNLKNSDIKWVIQKPDGKTSPAAKFKTINKSGKTAPVSTLTGKDEVELINTKANRTLNNLIHVKAVNVLQPGIVYADFQVAIRPTMIDTLEVGPKTTPKKSGVEPIENRDDEYTLKLNMGTKFKLSVKPKSDLGKVYNTGVKYEVVSGSADLITISNTGIINPIASTVTSQATIKISTLETFDGTDTPVKEARIYVTINPFVKKLMLNTTSLTMAPDSSQRFLLATSPLSTYNSRVKVGYTNTAVTLYKAGTEQKVNPGDVVTVNGVMPFEVRVNEGIDDKTKFGAPVITFDYEKDSTQGYTDESKATQAKLKLKFTPVLGNIKKINQKLKAKDGVVELNVPVGVPTDLKVSVTPTSAFNEIDWVTTGDSVTFSDLSESIEIRNGWVIPKEVGLYEFAGVAQGVTDKGEKLSTYTYRINVYQPTSIIGVKEDSSAPQYSLYAGYLMDKNVTLTTNDPLIEGGKWINLKTIRSAGSTEKITWTSNNPSAVTVNNNDDDTFSIYLNSPGTYVITGKSEFSKLKYSFRVKVKEVYSEEQAKDLSKPENAEKLEVLYAYLNDMMYMTAGNQIDIAAGEKIQLAITAKGEIAAKVKWTPDTTAKQYISVTSKGLVTGKKYSKDPVKVEYTYYGSTKALKNVEVKGTVMINVMDPEATTTISSKIPEYASKDVSLKLKASVKGAKANLVTTTFYYTKDTQDKAQKKTIGTDNIFKPGEKGTYYIWAETIANESKEPMYITDIKSIKLLDVMVNKATVTTPTINAVQRTAGQTFIVHVLAEAKEAGQKPDVEGIVWSSSNYNVAHAEEVTTSTGAYATAKITVGDNAFGKATITGTLKNSGKKVKVTVTTVADGSIVAPSKVTLKVTPSKTVKVPVSDDPKDGNVSIKTVYLESEKTATGKLTPSITDKTKKVVPGQVVWFVDKTGGQNYTKYDFANPDADLPIVIDRLGRITIKSGASVSSSTKINITAGYEYKDPTTGQWTEIKAIDGENNENNYYQLTGK